MLYFFYGKKRYNIKPKDKIKAFAQDQEKACDKARNARKEGRSQEI